MRKKSHIWEAVAALARLRNLFVNTSSISVTGLTFITGTTVSMSATGDKRHGALLSSLTHSYCKLYLSIMRVKSTVMIFKAIFIPSVNLHRSYSDSCARQLLGRD